MNLLSIETATAVCGAALTQDGALLVEYRSALKNEHGRLLALAVEKILADAEWQVSDLNAIAVSIGPGSFTGLRIGLALAKGLALARDIPIIAVPTLEALASQAPVQLGLIAALLRSRADEYYLGLYERSETGDVQRQEVRIIRWQEIPAAVPAEALLIGQSAIHTLPPGYHAAAAHFSRLSACSIARLGHQRLRDGKTENTDLLEPLYLQEFIVGKPKQPVFTAEGHVR